MTGLVLAMLIVFVCYFMRPVIVIVTPAASPARPRRAGERSLVDRQARSRRELEQKRLLERALELACAKREHQLVARAARPVRDGLVRTVTGGLYWNDFRVAGWPARVTVTVSGEE